MKILQLSYALSSGGAERFVVDLCNRLAEDCSNEVVLVTTDDDKQPENIHYLDLLSPRVRFMNLHCRSGHQLKAFWRVLRTIRREEPDIVHAHCNLLLLYLSAFSVPHIRYIHTLHNLAWYCLQYKWCKPINRWLYQNRVQAVTISTLCHQSFIDLYGINNAICITNGRELLLPSGIIPSDIESGRIGEKPVFIHVARYGVQKNQSRLFWAFEKLQSEGIDFVLLVVGNGYEPVITEKYKNNQQIHIIGERKNVADYMALADFFVLSSDYEGLPLSLLEAMSLGVIPISTPAGGVADVIRDGENGFMTNSFDNNEFYLKIKQAIREKDTIDRNLIKKEYKQKYSMEICADKYYNLYKNAQKI